MDWKKLLNNERLRPGSTRHSEDVRNDFESDFGRIIFSPAMRRMHDKTQVFPLTADDNIHSRLTHSLEVMSVGYSLGVKLCESQTFVQRVGKDTYTLFREIPILLKNSCLIHDIGNPPFGHFGETVIQNYFKEVFAKRTFQLTESEKADFTEFDGNAQGLRVLTKLQILNDVYGLNLTCATLGTYIKYPNYIKKDKYNLETKKRGVFQSEKEYFNKIAEECGLNVKERVIRHPLCYLMEAADSICYLVMDIEDGYNKHLFDLEYLYNKFKSIPSINGRIEEIYRDPNDKYKNDITKAVNFRILIIQTLVLLAVGNFERNLDAIENGTYGKELILDDSENELAKQLFQICKEKIFKFREITSLEITGHSVIKGLLDFYVMSVFHEVQDYRERAQSLISNSILNVAFEENRLPRNSNIDDLNDYYKLRVIVDFITGMTDQFAVNHYQKISGQKIS